MAHAPEEILFHDPVGHDGGPAGGEALFVDATVLASTESDALDASASMAMGQELLCAALRALGDRLDARLPVTPTASPGHAAGPIELLLVGGAAGMLTGLLDPERTTTDCDVALYQPPSAREVIEALAGDLAGEFGLSEHWLNAGGAPWRDAMPPGWESRRVLVLEQGPLAVFAVGRLDLIALKLVAGRAQDIEDLEAMRLTGVEVDHLRAHFAGWTDDSWPEGVIAGARELLEILVDASADDVAERTRRFLDGEDSAPDHRGAPHSSHETDLDGGDR